MKIDSGRILTITARIIVTLPLIFVGYMWNPRIITCLLRSPCRPLFDEIVLTILIDASIILICLAIWFPGSKGRLWLGRIGAIIWLLILALPTLMIVTEFEHTDTETVIAYLVMVISTVIVTIYLWMPRRLEMVKK